MAPTGFVDIFVVGNNNAVATLPLDSNGNFTVTTGSFANTDDVLFAKYRGDANSQPSQSPNVNELPFQGPQATNTSLSIAPNPANTGQPQVISGTVSYV